MLYEFFVTFICALALAMAINVTAAKRLVNRKEKRAFGALVSQSLLIAFLLTWIV